MVWFQLLMLAGLILVLIKSSDVFVEAAARIAKIFGLSQFVIGLTIIAIGTSLPELGSDLMAAFAGETELAMGDIVGSCIANIGLILGLSALVAGLKTNKKIFLRDALILLSVTLLFFFLASDGVLSFVDGLILVVIMPLYLAYLFRVMTTLRKRFYHFSNYFKTYSFTRIKRTGVQARLLKPDVKYEKFVGKGFDLESYHKIRGRVSKFKKDFVQDVILLGVGGLGIYLSALYLIPTAVDIASKLGVSETIIGATLLAIGTSLPELTVSISSIRKGFSNMLLGNMLGSNIINMSLVAGLASMVRPLNVQNVLVTFTLPFLLLLTAFLFVFVRTGWRIKRYEGAGLFILYVIFMYVLISS